MQSNQQIFFNKPIKTIVVVLAAAFLLVIANLFFIRLSGILALITGYFFLEYFHSKRTEASIPFLLLSLIVKNLGYIFIAYGLQKALCSFGIINDGICALNNFNTVMLMETIAVFIPVLLIFLVFIGRGKQFTDGKVEKQNY